MSLSLSHQKLFVFRTAVLALTVMALFAVTGCGGSEETTQGETTGQTGDTTSAKPYDQALTNFVGAEQPDSSQKPVVKPVQTSAADEIQKQMDALKTDNTDLRQKNLKLEDDVQRHQVPDYRISADMTLERRVN